MADNKKAQESAKETRESAEQTEAALATKRQKAQQSHDPNKGSGSQTGNPEGGASLQHTRRQVVTTEHKPGDPMVNPNDEGRDDLADHGGVAEQDVREERTYVDDRTYLPVDARSVETAYATQDNIVRPAVRDVSGQIANPEAEREEHMRMAKVAETLQSGGHIVSEQGVFSGDEKEREKQEKAAAKNLPDEVLPRQGNR